VLEADDQPGPGYVVLLGEFVFWVAHLEWSVLSDLAASANDVPGIDVQKLLGSTTASIANQLETMAKSWDEAPNLMSWATLAVAALRDVAERRNHVLHARPASTDAGRILLRHRWAGPNQELVRFFVTEEYLREEIAIVKHWAARLEPLRGMNIGYDAAFLPPA
jgi:hypothetical protein